MHFVHFEEKCLKTNSVQGSEDFKFTCNFSLSKKHFNISDNMHKSQIPQNVTQQVYCPSMRYDPISGIISCSLIRTLPFFLFCFTYIDLTSTILRVTETKDMTQSLTPFTCKLCGAYMLSLDRLKRHKYRHKMRYRYRHKKGSLLDNKQRNFQGQYKRVRIRVVQVRKLNALPSSVKS